MAEISVPVHLVLTVKDVSTQIEHEVKKAGKILPISKESVKKSGETFAAGLKGPLVRVLQDALMAVRYQRFVQIFRTVLGATVDESLGVIKRGGKVGAVGGAGIVGRVAMGVAITAAIVALTATLSGILETFNGFMSAFKSFFNLMKAIGKLIGMIVFPFIAIFIPLFIALARVLTPVAKTLMMILRPIYKRIMDALKATARKSPVEMIAAVLGATVGGFVDLVSLAIIAGFGMLLKNILIPAIGFFVKLILIVLGGIALSLAKLITLLTGGKVNVEGAVASAVAGAVGAVGLAEAQLTTAIQVQMNSLIASFTETGIAISNFVSVLGGFDAALVAVASAFDSRFGLLISGVLSIVDHYRTQAETLANDAILTTQEKLNLLFGLYQTTVDSITRYLDEMAPKWVEGFEAMKAASDLALPFIKDKMNDTLLSMLISTTSYGNLIKTDWNDALEALYSYTKNTKTKIDDLLGEARRAVSEAKKAAERPGILSHIAAGAIMGAAGGALVGGVGAVPGAIVGGAVGGIAGVLTGAPLRDFIMRPGQSAVSFSPSDTIIGMKDTKSLGGGNTVNIQNINVYSNATNTRELVREISKELQYTLRGRSSYGY